MFDTTKFESDLHEVGTFAEDMYGSNFSGYFEEVRNLHLRLESKSQPITDEELEYVLTELPLSMFSASEALNRVKLERETLKIQSKQHKLQVLEGYPEKSPVPKTDYVAGQMAEYDLMISIYDSVISRVDSELSFCKEFIMGCKKIWDGRRSTEKSNPVGEIDIDKLPDYQKDAYIK